MLLGADVANYRWRECSIEPLSVPVDLSRPGRYETSAGGFDNSEYLPAFRLQLPVSSPKDWNWGRQYKRIWGDSPPEVLIEVLSGDGSRLLVNRSLLTRESGWIVTGELGARTIEIYKPLRLTPAMFGSLQANVTVLQGSESASAYASRFVIQDTNRYALMGPAFLFVLSVLMLALAAVVLAVVQIRRGG